MWHGVRCGTVCNNVRRYGMMVRFNIVYGKITVCDMVCWWYGMMVRCGGCITWLNIAWWNGMFQYIRSVRDEYVVCISSVTINISNI